MISNEGIQYSCKVCGRTYGTKKSFFMHLDQPERKKCLRSFSSSNFGSSLILDDDEEDDDGEEIFPEDDEGNVLDVLEGSNSMLEEEVPTMFGEDVKKMHHENCKTVSKEELKGMISGASVPPAEEFRYAVYAILNHPSIPLYI